MEIQTSKGLKSKKTKLIFFNNFFVFSDIAFTKRNYEKFYR